MRNFRLGCIRLCVNALQHGALPVIKPAGGNIDVLALNFHLFQSLLP